MEQSKPVLAVIAILIASLFSIPTAAAADLALSASPTNSTATTDDVAEYDITVTNTGDEDLTVSLSSSQESGCNGFTSNLDSSVVSVSQGESETVSLTVSINDQATGDCVTFVNADGVASDPSDNAQADIEVTTTAEGVAQYSVKLTYNHPSNGTVNYDGEDDEAEWTADVENTGDTDATIQLAMSSKSDCDSDGLEASVEPQVMSLPSGDEDTATVTVNFPDGSSTESGDHCFVLEATVSNDPNPADQANDSLNLNLNIPVDPSEWNDTDGDGVGDNADTDVDGDGVANENDMFPVDVSEWLDTDGDGIGDNTDDDDDDDYLDDVNDFCPQGETNWTSGAAIGTDHDGDGCRDAGEDMDDDGDGVNDTEDGCPLGQTGWTSNPANDADGDGCHDIEDYDDDGDGVSDNEDEFPNDPNETNDFDGDGIGDNSDAFPEDSTEWDDTDGDGIGDNSDVFPDDPTETSDSDGDGIGDNAEAEEDGGGLPGFGFALALASILIAGIRATRNGNDRTGPSDPSRIQRD